MKRTGSPRSSARTRTARAGITTMIGEVPSGVRRRTVLRIKLVPRTRAKAFGLPRRVDKPAASTTIRTKRLRRGYHARMKNEHARLQRGPFLMPIWLLGMTALAGALVMIFAGWVWLTADSTTIIVIRHAEQVQDGSKDPPLTPAGKARAELLARLFGDARLPGHIDAIYVSARIALPTDRSFARRPAWRRSLCRIRRRSPLLCAPHLPRTCPRPHSRGGASRHRAGPDR